jgi:hypothetical protein
VAKRGHRSQARDIGNAEVQRMNAPHAVRCYVPRYGGSADTVIWEFEFEDINEHDAFWASWEGEEYLTKMNAVTESLSSEMYQLMD